MDLSHLRQETNELIKAQDQTDTHCGPNFGLSHMRMKSSLCILCPILQIYPHFMATQWKITNHCKQRILLSHFHIWNADFFKKRGCFGIIRSHFILPSWYRISRKIHFQNIKCNLIDFRVIILISLRQQILSDMIAPLTSPIHLDIFI